jgi:ribosomal protein L5
MMGDYNSSATLPKISKENEFTLVDLQRPRKMGSKVELTKKDMANFLSNGTITKEFIKTNK